MRRSRSSSAASAVAAATLAGCFLHGSPPSPACPHDRTVSLTTQAEVDAFATCETASSVSIHGYEAVDTSGLHALTTIAGDFVIGPSTSSEEISVTELREVGGAITIHNNDLLRSVFLPRLERVGRIDVDGNPSLATLSLSSLTTVTGAVAVTDNQELELIDASSLVTVSHGLVIANAPRLVHVVVPELASAETVTVDGTPKLSAETIAALRAKASP